MIRSTSVVSAALLLAALAARPPALQAGFPLARRLLDVRLVESEDA